MTLDDDRLDSLIRRDLTDGTGSWTAPPKRVPIAWWARVRRGVPALAAVGLALLLAAAMGSAIFSLATAGGHSPLATIFSAPTSASSSPSAASPTAYPSGRGGEMAYSPCPSPDQPGVSGCGGAVAATPTAGPTPPTCPPTAACAQPASPPQCETSTTTSSACRPPSPAPSGSPGAQCAQSDADISVATDKQNYASTDYVNVTGTIHNHSAHACVVRLHSNCNPILQIDGPDGQTYYRSFPKGSMQPCYVGDAVTLQPGQSASEMWTWYAGNCPPNAQPGSCSTTYAPSGAYSVTLTWQPYGTATSRFTRA